MCVLKRAYHDNMRLYPDSSAVCVYVTRSKFSIPHMLVVHARSACVCLLSRALLLVKIIDV